MKKMQQPQTILPRAAKRRTINAEDKISRKEIMRLLKKDRLKASKKTIVINGKIYVSDDYVRQMIKSIKGDTIK